MTAPAVTVVEPAAAEEGQRRAAGALLAAGLGPGDRVAFCLPSSADLLMAVLGALRRGIVPVLVNATLLPAERDVLMADAEPSLVVMDEAALAALGSGDPVELADYPLARPMHYTSGTTGRAKGVWSGVLDEESARLMFEDEADLWGFAADDTHLVCSPMYHSVSIRFAAGTLLRGGRLIILGRFASSTAAAAVRQHRPTTTFLAPTALQRLLAEGAGADNGRADGRMWDSLRLVVHAGSPCPPALKWAALERLRPGALWEFYGSTEGQFTACGPDEWVERPGTVGRARPGRRLRVDEKQMVWCRCPAYGRFRYWRDDEATTRAWQGDEFTVGDLGRLDGDGYLFLDGRRDDLVISGGVNVYPAEVEAVLADAPGVVEVAVFGLADETWGERVCAAVVGPAEEADLRAHLAARLAPYKRPKTYFRIGELPRTATGKLRRRALPSILGLEPDTGGVGPGGGGPESSRPRIPTAPNPDGPESRRPRIPTAPNPEKISGVPIATVNPATGKTEQTFAAHDEIEIEAKLTAAATAAADYRGTSFAERARWMVTAAELLEGEIPAVARVMTTEMGKTFASAKAEAAKCAMGLRFFAEHAEGFLADEEVSSAAADSRVIYQPMGPVLAVMPWNFPLWQVMRFAAPALMAGNVGLLKHASNVPQTALFIEDLFRRAGFPEGVFQTLLIPAGRVAGVVEDPRVRAVTLTGSEEAGRSVAETAGRAIKKTVLELGGSDPFVVMASADLDDAVRVGVTARVQNNGQSCIAAKRFIVQGECYEDFEAAYVTAMASLSVGDPLEPGSEVGPLALASGRDEVTALVDDARDQGAAILCGGRPLEGPGFYYPPTVITGIAPSMRVAREEVFGPVALLYRVEDAAEAVAVANDSGFGLGASVWSGDEAEQRRFVEELDVGMVFVNAMVASTPELPFGGTKRSGYGRELASLGIREFCEAKSVWRA